ncbi:hypothetical protein SAMN05216353_10719 [Halobacillus alkaliphilus]|uniref:Uncharacterized protein n=1 Tax=Halobacillus alkaliphilus TaxID=396056 RepID=A0A1I2L1I5_9BACI|nr:hypothetical protein [Halobacillus alkaliphilus]SFF72693.1 hypothetical protein SAMN05216353_10719 [Halobacillus alkaliphilus]
MNVEILILFINATLVTVISSIVVIAILRKQYLPVIKEMEKKEKQEENTESEEKRINSNI